MTHERSQALNTSFWLAKEPTGVYVHDDGRPMLGRKLKGKSKRELAYLGLEHKDDGAEGDPKSEPLPPDSSKT